MLHNEAIHQASIDGALLTFDERKMGVTWAQMLPRFQGAQPSSTAAAKTSSTSGSRPSVSLPQGMPQSPATDGYETDRDVAENDVSANSGIGESKDE